MAGVLALFIPSAHQLAARNGPTPTVMATTLVPTSVVGGSKMVAMMDDDILHKSRLLAERQKLRKQGVPEAEINMILPLVPDVEIGTTTSPAGQMDV